MSEATSLSEPVSYKSLSTEYLEILGQPPRSWFGRFLNWLRESQRVEAARRLLRSGALAGHDLTRINCSLIPGNAKSKGGSPLIAAQLPRCKLGDMSGVVMKGANLEGASFKERDLRGADFEGANLKGADFEGANLWVANFQRANLKGAQFIGAKLLLADFRGARGLETLFFKDVVIEDAVFSEGFQPSSTVASDQVSIEGSSPAPVPPTRPPKSNPGTLPARIPTR